MAARKLAATTLKRFQKLLEEERDRLVRTIEVHEHERNEVRLAETAAEPGQVEHLPFRWHEDPKETKWHPAEPSPIIAMIKKRQKGQASA